MTEFRSLQGDALGTSARLPAVMDVPVTSAYGIAGFRMPWATFGLLAILVATFVAEHRLGVAPEGAPLAPNVATLYAFGGGNSGAVINHGEVLRLFSPMLLHVNVAHLAGNLFGLLVVGWPLERLVGRPWWLAIFVVSSLVGSAAGLVAYPAYVAQVGASVGIAGLLAAKAILNFRLTGGRGRVLALVRTALVAVVVFLPVKERGGLQTAHASHLGGALAGAALGAVLLRTWTENRRLPRFQKAGLAVGVGGLTLALLGIPASLCLSKEVVASFQGCAGADPDKKIHGCTALIDSGVGDRSAALLNRGYAHLQRGTRDQAITDLTEAIGLNPKLGEAYLGRGAAYLDTGRVELAVADESQAIALNPKMASAYTVRGMAHSRKREGREAISDYTKALVLNGGDADAYFHRGSEYIEENRLDEAVADMTKVLELRPRKAEAYNNRAWALHLKGEDTLALPDAEKAVTLAPGHVVLLETRAEIYEKLGRKRDAVADYRAVLASDGSVQLARNGLSRLGADPGRSPP